MPAVEQQITWNRKVDQIIIGLAYEGVPVMAMARAMHLPANEISEVVDDAVTRGIIVRAPAQDWPSGSRFIRHPLFGAPSVDEAALLVAAVKLFNLTRLQASLFLALVRRKLCPRDMLHELIESRRPVNSEPTDPKIIDVAICNLRKRLGDTYVIATVRGCGFVMPDEYRRKAAAVLLDYFDVASNDAAHKCIIGDLDEETPQVQPRAFTGSRGLPRLGAAR